MDSPAARSYASAAERFLQIAAHAQGHLGEVGLGVWSVRDLLGHTSRSFTTVETYLQAGAGDNLQVDLADATAYYRVIRGALADAQAVAERGRAAGASLGQDPLAAVSELAARVLARVGQAEADTLMVTPFGVMTLEGYLPTRVVELTVHTCDLAAALHVDAAMPADAAELTFAVLGSLAAACGSAGPALLALTGRAPLPQGYSLM